MISTALCSQLNDNFLASYVATRHEYVLFCVIIFPTHKQVKVRAKTIGGELLMAFDSRRGILVENPWSSMSETLWGRFNAVYAYESYEFEKKHSNAIQSYL